MTGAALSNSTRATPGRDARSGGKFERRNIAGVVWSVATACADELLDERGLRWERWKELAAVQTVKTGPHRTVYRLLLASGTFYVKRFRVADWKARVRNMLRATPAECEWRAAQRMAELGLPTFEPVALGVSVAAGA